MSGDAEERTALGAQRSVACDWRAAVRASLSRRALDPAAEADLVEEMAQHLEEEFGALTRRGASPEAARQLLLDRLCDETLAGAAERRAPYREPHAVGASPRGAWLDALWQDVRYGCRALVRTPAVSIVAVLSFALTIGANTAVFGLLDAVLLEPLAVPHPGQLFVVQRAITNGRSAPAATARDRPLLGVENYTTVVRYPGLDGLQAYATHPAHFEIGGEAVPDGWMDLVSDGYFALMRVPPALGRTFSTDDIASGALVGVVSYEFWKDHMQSDPAAIGRTVRVNGAPVTVIGVSRQGYRGLFFGRDVDITVPISAASGLRMPTPESWGVMLVGRAGESRSPDAVATAVDAALRRCCAEQAESDGGAKTGRLVVASDLSHGLPWGQDIRPRYSRVLYVLMFGVLILLLLACANVTTLLIARGTAREREFAVRASLGASRYRIARQLTVESLELALAGAILGFGLSIIGTRALAHVLPAAASALADDIPLHASPAILAFTVATIALCTLVCGLLPAIHVSRLDLRTPLAGGSSPSRLSRRLTLDRALVALQVTMGLVLVSTAMLFASTLRNLQQFDFGFGTSRIVLASFGTHDLPGGGATLMELSAALQRSVSGIPGVEAAATASVTPLGGQSRRAQEAVMRYGDSVVADIAYVSPGFFDASGMRLLHGEDLSAGASSAAPVAVISASLARRYFRGQDPTGREFSWAWATKAAPVRIVGVARDGYYPRFDTSFVSDVVAPTDMIYLPMSDARDLPHGLSDIEVVARSTGDPVSVEAALRRAVTAIPNAHLTQLASVTQVLDNSIPRERLAATLGTIFAVIALSLAAAGFFGVVAYAVVRRTREVGIRIALGARPVDTMWLMLRETLALTLVGAAAGIGLGRLAANGVRSQLYGISAGDPRVPLAAALVLVVVGLIASALPALRATRVDPLIALRSE